MSLPSEHQNTEPGGVPSLERRFDVNDMRLAAQCWGAGNAIPVIAIHGWLDNSASFSSLAPLLDDCEVLALDLAGHGHSDHRSQHGAYNIWDDLLDIVAIADAMNWPRFNLLAHSRGAFVALLLAAALPERINAAVMLDGILTVASEVDQAPATLGNYLKDQKARYQRPSRLFETVEDAVATRAEKLGLSESETLPLVERALNAAADGWRWRHDARVGGASAFKLTNSLQTSFLNAFEAKGLLIMAEDGFGKWPELKERVSTNANITITEHPGGHHMHMQRAHYQSLAGQIAAFFQASREAQE